MTTLIVTDTGFYSDGRITSGTDILTESFQKVFIYSGLACAVAGNVYDLTLALKDYIDGKDVSTYRDSRGEMIIQRGDHRERLHFKDGELVMYREWGLETFGSGTQFALAALDFGKTPEDAIRYAMTRDSCTGGEIFSVLFEDLEK